MVGLVAWQPSAQRSRLFLLAGLAAACLAVLPVQALELSANAIANERNAIAQPVLAGNGASSTIQAVNVEVPEATGAAQMSAIASAELRPVAQEKGGASWYARYFHGRRTANGERYDQNELTAAHKTLPFGTVVRVRSEVNGKEVDVRINDRGPFVAGRVIDLSQAAANALGMLQLGVKRVTLMLPPGLRLGADKIGLPPSQTAATPAPVQSDTPTSRIFNSSTR